MNNTKDEILLRIARLLMLHGSFTDNLGLINGKMGISIFFFHLSRYTKKKIFEDFAGEMIDEIYKEIHNHYPVNFENGLCGIAWGMEYLIQNKFVIANANEVLEDLDSKILEWDVRKIKDCSLEMGLEGIAHYVISRCTGKTIENTVIPIDYITDLIIALETNSRHNTKISEVLKSIINNKYFEVCDTLLTDLISNIKFKTVDIFNFNKTRALCIGDSGYAGIGLKLIFKEE